MSFAWRLTRKLKNEFLKKLRPVSKTLASSRPTAVNLFWAIEMMNKTAQSGKNVTGIKKSLIAEAKRIDAENDGANRHLSEFGAELIRDGFTILTHCNTGSLATAAYGTALGVVKMAKERGKKVKVYATETRPLLQGARLTTWELMQEGIPITLITDSMAGYFMQQKKINCVIVGADRIAANGDVANKIVTDLLDFTRIKQPAQVKVDLSTMINESLSYVTVPEQVKVNVNLNGHSKNVRTDPEQAMFISQTVEEYLNQ
jgi:methylthioribose-1-phosphate isomerase